MDIDDQDNNMEESFSKKGILERVNRKLMKNSRNSKREEQRKNSNILENNFLWSTFSNIFFSIDNLFHRAESSHKLFFNSLFK